MAAITGPGDAERGQQFLIQKEANPKSTEIKIFNYLLSEAENGNVSVYSELAACYALGVGVEPSRRSAKHYFKLAAANKDSSAMCIIGYCYLNGEGEVEQDPKKGIKILKKAAALGHSVAQDLLNTARSDQL